MSESGEMRKAMKAALHNAEVAQKNEEITRKRVESLERVFGGFLGLPLWARFRWLLFGFPPVPKAPEPEPEVPDVH